jgi:alanyl-tRNA synthetase
MSATRSERLFDADPYLLEFEAAILARLEHEGRPAVILDRTAFYPEGGGQPSDTGTLGEARVIAVVEDGADVLHVLDRPLALDRVSGRVDGGRRNDHRQQHHGQHLLSRAFLEIASARTIGFRLGTDVTTIDLDRAVTPEEARRAERRANEIACEARPVRVVTLEPGEARAHGIEPPAGARGAIRVVEAEGFDVQACGGTHPRSTAEVGMIVVLATEGYKGGTRVTFVCGGRALSAVRGRLDCVTELGRILSSPPEGLADAARRLKEALAASEKRGRDLALRALEVEARRLAEQSRAAAGTHAVVVRIYDGWPAEDLRTLASRLVALAPCVALLGSRSGKAHLVFAQSQGLPHDIPALLRAAAEHVGGRGGGRGNLAQGGSHDTTRLDEALAQAAAAVKAGR